MAYEHLITADWHDTGVFTSVKDASSVQRSATTARTGTHSFRLDNSGWVLLSKVPNATAYLGFGVWVPSSIQGEIFRIYFREGSTYHVSVYPQVNSGLVDARRATDIMLGSGGGTFASGKWMYLGIKVTVHDSSGIVQVYQDGVEILNLTSKDTRNGGTGVIDNIMLYSGAGWCYIDDIKVRDDAIPSVAGLRVKLPSADGGTNGWTPSAGAEYQCVDEAPPTFTDYISADAATVNTLSNFAHAGLDADAYDSIECVAVVGYAQLDAAGSGNVRMVLNSNGTESDGASTVLSTSPKYISHFVEADPNTTAAWTKAGVDAALFGVETI